MPARTRTGPFTFDEFVDLVPEHQKADVLEGVIYLTPPEACDCARLLTWLAVVLGQFVEQRELGDVLANRIAYRLAADTAVEPDVAVLRTEHRDRVRKEYVEGPPDLVIEIVSPESVSRDYEHKRRLYEQYGVPEYWIIDPDEKRATFLVLEGGKYVEVVPVEHIFRSRAVPGFALDVRWLWQRPLRRTLGVVQHLLAGSGAG
ncbi:MAG: Uma2 family endonuclease [Planctomycetota bacterium]